MVTQMSREEARRFLVARHLLATPRSLPPSAASVLEVVSHLGSLQFDPLEVPGARNHDLVLFARIREYERAWLQGLLYAPRGERRLFEAYNKSLNILLLEELPYHRFAWDHARKRYANGILKKTRRAPIEILERIRAEGALESSAFKESHGRRIPWHWAKTVEGRAVLEALFEAGHVGIATRDGNRRAFDLVDRLFPEEILARTVTRDEAVRHRLLSRYRGHGLLAPSGSPEIMTGIAEAPVRKRMTLELVEEGVLAAVAVEGVRGHRYVLASDLARFGNELGKAFAPHVSFIAPLDPLLWDRALLVELFDFDYKWEVYTPEAKRKFGYYVLPILYGDRLVGRIEPRFDRATKELAILGLWFEKGFDAAQDKEFLRALGGALEAYKRFVGALSAIAPNVGRDRLAKSLLRSLM